MHFSDFIFFQDWRSHLDQIHQHRKNIDDTLSTTKQQLDKLHSDINRSMEKIGSREKYLNNQLEQLILEYRTVQDQLAQVKEQYKSVSGGVTERSRILSQVVMIFFASCKLVINSQFI